MQTVYYIFMRKLSPSVLLPLLTVCLVRHWRSSQPHRPRPHPGLPREHDHWHRSLDGSVPLQGAVPEKIPVSKGVVALRISFRNDSDESIKIDLPHIACSCNLNEDERQELEPLTADEVADTVLLKGNGKDPTAKRIPLPIPVR